MARRTPDECMYAAFLAASRQSVQQFPSLWCANARVLHREDPAQVATMGMHFPLLRTALSLSDGDFVLKKIPLSFAAHSSSRANFWRDYPLKYPGVYLVELLIFSACGGRAKHAVAVDSNLYEVACSVRGQVSRLVEEMKSPSIAYDVLETCYMAQIMKRVRTEPALTDQDDIPAGRAAHGLSLAKGQKRRRVNP